MTGPVLIGFDGSPSAARAIERVARLMPGARVVVAHVWHPYGRRPPGSVPGPIGELVVSGARNEDEESAIASEDLARRGAELAGGLGLEATPRSHRSDRNAGPALMELAGELGAEVIVIGPRGLSTVAAALGTARRATSRCTATCRYSWCPRPPGSAGRQRRPRREAKNARRCAAASSASTPPSTSGRWLSAGCASTSRTLPAAPAFGSAVA